MKPRGTPKQRKATIQQRMQRATKLRRIQDNLAALGVQLLIGPYPPASELRACITVTSWGDPDEGVGVVAPAVIAAWNEGPAIPRQIRDRLLGLAVPPQEHAPTEPAG